MARTDVLYMGRVGALLLAFFEPALFFEDGEHDL
jgi:hypothetical protein